MEYNDFPLPSDYRQQTDFVFARLMYPEVRFSVGFGRRTNGDWREGYTYWTQDYPRADRHFLTALAPFIKNRRAFGRAARESGR